MSDDQDRRAGACRLVWILFRKNMILAWRKKRFAQMLGPTVVYMGCLQLLYSQLGNQGILPVVWITPLYVNSAALNVFNFAVVDIVEEKETKLKEMQMIYGLQRHVFWIAWGLTYVVYTTLCVSILIGFLSFGGIFARTPVWILTALFVLYYCTLFALAFVSSVIFDKARTAAVVGNIILLVWTAAGFAIRSSDASPTLTAFASIFPAVPFFVAIWDIAAAEASGLTPDIYDPMRFPIGRALLLLLADCAIYGGLAWYLDAVWQGEYGSRAACCFCLRRAPPVEDEEDMELVSAQHLEGPGAGLLSGPASFASSGVATAVPVLRTNGLRKVYTRRRGNMTTAEVEAVKGLTLDVQRGEIFCLLGHNGAGKTSLVHMLIGLIPPTAGSARVSGCVAGSPEARQRLSFCPQDNPFFEQLTVAEHCVLFATIRGLHVEVDLEGTACAEYLRKLGLWEKRNELTKTLSGGQKRRLWVATALLGSADVILLDEPTSGMDPSSRQDLWSLLEEQREAGRSILFTTHYLEEADILADRKAVMSMGEMRCVGTSQQLKAQYGVGYTLRLSGDELDPDACFRTITAFANGKRETAGHNELAVQLPLDAATSFGPLLRELDRGKQQFGWTQCFLEATTLEEVFLRLADDHRAELGDAPAEPAPTGGQGPMEDLRPSVASSARAMARLRLQIFAHSKWQMFTQFGLPILLMWVSELVDDNTDPSTVPLPGFQFTLYATLALGLTANTFTAQIVQEKELRCKPIAMAQGLQIRSYWLGTAVVHYIVSLITAVSVPIMAQLFQVDGIAGPAMYIVGIEVILYPASLLAWSYAWSFVFQDQATALRFLPAINLLGTMGPMLLVAFAWIMGLAEIIPGWVAHVMNGVFSIVLPPYNLPGTMVLSAVQKKLCEAKGCTVTSWTYFELVPNDAPSPLVTVVGSIVQILLVGSCLVRLELRRFRPYSGPSPEASPPPLDPDVLSEQHAALQLEASSTSILTRELLHEYPARGNPVRALCGVSFSVRPGECFGLLGPNGAGKTTMMGILTGEIAPPTQGSCAVDGYPVAELGHSLTRVGFCPQFDALWPNATGYEHLVFYARVKGFSEHVSARVDWILDQVGLDKADARRTTNTYSGGMKRRLSLGIALIGAPALLVLDEMTTGVDAVAKRRLWDVLRNRPTGQTCLFSTHSMEEAEALSERIGIMINGQFRCMGTSTHLRQKHGVGYRLEVMCRREEAAAKVASLFPSATLTSLHRGRALLGLCTVTTSLADTFDTMAANQARLEVVNYSISQPTLEQVFLKFAAEQREVETA